MWISLVLFINIIFLSLDLVWCTTWVSCHILPVSFFCDNFHCLSFFFSIFTILKSTSWLSHRLSPNLCLSEAFFMISIGVIDLEKNTAEVKCPSHHTISGIRDSHISPWMITLTTWLSSSSLPGFYHELAIFSFQNLCLGSKLLNIAYFLPPALS